MNKAGHAIDGSTLSSRIEMTLFRLAIAVVAAGVFVATACAPEPRSALCDNDGFCEKLGEHFHYCLESRCVECVGDASCGSGHACVDGACSR